MTPPITDDITTAHQPKEQRREICIHTMKPVSNDHLYDNIYYLWFIQ